MTDPNSCCALLDSPAQMEIAAWIASRSLLDSQLKSQPALATRFFQYVARHAAQELYYWLIRDYPSAVFAYKLDVYTPPGFEPVMQTGTIVRHA